MSVIRNLIDRSQRLLFTSVGLSLLAVHWLVVTFAYSGDFPEPGFDNYTLLSAYISFVNIVPLLFAYAVSSLVGQVVSHETWLTIYMVLAIIFASIQWLLIGSFVQFLWDQYHPRLSKIRLKDESL